MFRERETEKLPKCGSSSAHEPLSLSLPLFLSSPFPTPLLSLPHTLFLFLSLSTLTHPQSHSNPKKPPQASPLEYALPISARCGALLSRPTST